MRALRTMGGSTFVSCDVYIFNPELANLAWRRVSRTSAREGSMSSVRCMASESAIFFLDSESGNPNNNRQSSCVQRCWPTRNLFHARVSPRENGTSRA
jgi:hypothetical protein